MYVIAKGDGGAGFVIPLARAYPTAREEYIKWSKGEAVYSPVFGNASIGLGVVQFVQVRDNAPKIVCCNMVAQTMGGRRPLRYDSLVQCMIAVRDRCRLEMNASIHAPLFGSDLAGGNWLFIEELIRDTWLAEGLDVTIYYLPERIPSNWTPPA